MILWPTNFPIWRCSPPTSWTLGWRSSSWGPSHSTSPKAEEHLLKLLARGVERHPFKMRCDQGVRNVLPNADELHLVNPFAGIAYYELFRNQTLQPSGEFDFPRVSHLPALHSGLA